ncbi:hypothetical protein NPD8_3863 (plasmid) [Clostridium botulinum]|uniref:Uncharacterized protein n=2 Tax=Clostridium botulinum TaxID=1491 RepID=A0A1L7JNB1_CLOBO|nr:hypothetical protein [Clostridium botulinum]APU87189.1 hypothetical protein NPD8_3863 [Clostridium botulinum]
MKVSDKSMNFNDVYIRLNNGQTFEFKEQSVIDFSCFKCKNHLVKFSLTNGEKQCECTQDYLYDDGDTINVPKKYWLQAETAMMFGTCKNCGENIALINTIILDRKLHNDILDKNFQNCFVVYSEDDIIKDFKQSKQYSIILNNITIGKVIIYEKATINKDAVHGLLKDVNRNIALASLECLYENEDMNIPNVGICNGHYKSETQLKVWQRSSDIAINLINSIMKLL